jgi:SAM-dependent methyltransferase
MTTAIDFETRRFQSAAAHYIDGRAPYPSSLVARTVELLDLEPDHRLLDLGCGPGQLAIAFSPYVGSVVALDPEPAMLRIARTAAESLANVQVAAGSSNDIGPELGRFNAVVIGRAFHWMDREQTLRQFEQLVEPDGGIALFGDERPDLPENTWLKELEALTESFAAGDSVRQYRKSAAFRPHLSVLLDSAFSRLERISVIGRFSLTVDQLVDRVLSLSSTSRARLGDRADDLVDELRRQAPKWREGGVLTEVRISNALIAWRP